MESTGTRQVRQTTVNPAAASAERRPPMPADGAGASVAAKSTVGFGLPCANCRAYYSSSLPACPICKSTQRVLPEAAARVAGPPVSSQANEAKLLAEERERLRELKSQIYASQPPVAPAMFRCALDQNHNNDVEPAAICHTCYGNTRQQADRMEAALHIDTKEAAKIVYDAVWADSSDPSKTYFNAANALLLELRRRAGIGLLLGSNQPFAH